jgi:DNA-binding phage protein
MIGTSYRDFYPGISITVMVRPILTPLERERGRLLGATLRAARGPRSMVDVSAAAGIPVETLRKIETGRIVTPAFFTVAALAHALGLDLRALADAVTPEVLPSAATA